MCTMKVKQGKTLVYWSGSGKIVSNEDDANNNSDCNDIDANDGVSQISEKRTHKQANFTVAEDDLGEYNSKTHNLSRMSR